MRAIGRVRVVVVLSWVLTMFVLGVCVAAAHAGVTAARARVAAGQATAYAPVGVPGPRLSVPGPTLAAALSCSGAIRGAARPPVLLVTGTTVDPAPTSAGTGIALIRLDRYRLRSYAVVCR